MKNQVEKLSWWRDPLCHFALIGTLFFALDQLLLGGDPDSRLIVVNEGRIEHLVAVFERNWQRPPNDEELQRLIDDHVREEVLYREALRLGLDRNDTVVRRRLRLKMEFLARDLIDDQEPQPSALQHYFLTHAERYRRPATWTFRQVYIRDDGDSRQADSKARNLLAGLRAGASADRAGDSHLLPVYLRNADAAELDGQFGVDFTQQLAGVTHGEWAGPLRSAYGLHLVFIEVHQSEGTVEFAAVREQVLRDWQADAQERMLARQYELLREGYDVRVEPVMTPTGQSVVELARQ